MMDSDARIREKLMDVAFVWAALVIAAWASNLSVVGNSYLHSVTDQAKGERE